MVISLKENVQQHTFPSHLSLSHRTGVIRKFLRSFVGLVIPPSKPTHYYKVRKAVVVITTTHALEESYYCELLFRENLGISELWSKAY